MARILVHPRRIIRKHAVKKQWTARVKNLEKPTKESFITNRYFLLPPVGRPPVVSETWSLNKMRTIAREIPHNFPQKRKILEMNPLNSTKYDFREIRETVHHELQKLPTTHHANRMFKNYLDEYIIQKWMKRWGENREGAENSLTRIANYSARAAVHQFWKGKNARRVAAALKEVAMIRANSQEDPDSPLTNEYMETLIHDREVNHGLRNARTKLFVQRLEGLSAIISGKNQEKYTQLSEKERMRARLDAFRLVVNQYIYMVQIAVNLGTRLEDQYTEQGN